MTVYSTPYPRPSDGRWDAGNAFDPLLEKGLSKLSPNHGDLVALIVLSALDKLSLRRRFTTTQLITQLTTTQLAASIVYTLIAGRVRQYFLVMNFHDDVGRVRLVSR